MYVYEGMYVHSELSAAHVPLRCGTRIDNVFGRDGGELGTVCDRSYIVKRDFLNVRATAVHTTGQAAVHTGAVHTTAVPVGASQHAPSHRARRRSRRRCLQAAACIIAVRAAGHATMRAAAGIACAVAVRAVAV